MKTKDMIFVLLIALLSIFQLIKMPIVDSFTDLFPDHIDKQDLPIFTDDSWFIEYASYNPNKYRIYVQILVFLHFLFLDLFFWNSLFSFVSLLLIYFLVQPREKDLKIMALAYFLVMVFPLTFGVISSLLLVLMVKNSEKSYSPLLLVPIGLFREIGAWIGLGYFIFSGKNRKKTLLSFLLTVLVYFVFRFVLIGDLDYSPHPDSPPLITPFYVVNSFLNSSPLVVFYQAGLSFLVIFVTYFSIEKKLDKALVFWNLLPVLVFALFWEIQLWFPIVMVILAHRKYFPKQEGHDFKHIFTKLS